MGSVLGGPGNNGNENVLLAHHQAKGEKRSEYFYTLGTVGLYSLNEWH